MTDMLQHGTIGFTQFVALVAVEGSKWWDYPGLELWKFINLAIFLGLMTYILRRPLSDGLRNRRETIRQELLESRQERDQALAKLAEIESRLAQIDADVASIHEQGSLEADAERMRIAQQSELEISNLRERAHRDIENAGKVAEQELRRFVAQESVRLAGQTLRREIRVEDDARLIQSTVAQLGGRQN